MPAIPDPVLVGDTLTAALITAPEGIVLAVGSLPAALPPARIQRPSGPLVVRYGIPYLQQEAVLVPGLFASEYGALLVGREAWDYALEHTNLHPRADLVGLRDDGTQDQVMLRSLDFGRPVIVMAYTTEEAREPLATCAAYWAGPDALALPDLLTTHLPRLAALDDAPPA